MNAKVMEIAKEMLAEAGGDVGQEFPAATNTQLRAWAERLMEAAKRRDEMRPGMSEERRNDDAWLRDAIEHARQVAEKHGDTTCGQEHRRLVGWLEELRDLRAVGYLSRTLDALKKILELAKAGEASAPMSHAGDNCCHIVYACEDALSHLQKEPNANAGNMAKLREALAGLLAWCEAHTGACAIRVAPVPDDEAAVWAERKRAMESARAALAAPARNCDVGTAWEQAERFKEYCHSNSVFYRDMFGHDDEGRLDGFDCKKECPVGLIVDEHECLRDHCELVWAQMPYTETKKEDGAE